MSTRSGLVGFYLPGFEWDDFLVVRSLGLPTLGVTPSNLGSCFVLSRYVVMGPSGVEEWQAGGNRHLSLAQGTSVTVLDQWDGPGQHITVEELKNGEYAGRGSFLAA